MRCRGEGIGRSGNEWATPAKRHHANDTGQKGREAGMHMRMVVVVTGRRHLASPIGVGRRSVVGVVVTMLVAVVTEMGDMALRMFQGVTNTHDRRGGGVQ